MAVSFDEWRSAKRDGKQAVEKPDFAAWRLARNSKKKEEEDASLTGSARARIGVPTSVGAPPVSTSPNRFATPQTIPLGTDEVPTTGTIGAIAGLATGISNLGESVPASYREGRRTQQASVARQELDFNGRVTLEPARPAKYARGGVLVSPATHGKYLTGKDAEDYVASLEAPTPDTATMQEYSDEATVFGRAATSALSQPEQALSVLGGIAGAAVGMPGVGAAVGSVPAITAAYNSEYLRNRQAGLSKEESRANALAKLPIEALTEFVGGRFGAKSVPASVALGGAEEGAAQAGGILVDVASRDLSSAPEAYDQKIPDTLPQALGEIGEAALGGAFGAGAMHGAASLPSAFVGGLAKAREALAKAGGVSDGRPTSDSTKPSNKDAPVSKDPGYSAQSTTDTSSVKPISIPVKPADDLASREILPTGDTTTTAPLSPVQLTPADAGTIIDTRLSALREASQQNRLDDGTVKALQREDEELRLTLQEDESRKQQGILQTPERPYLSDNARGLISQKRAEIRERLEQHRAAVGYGNELRDLETRLGKLGESDTDVIALADSLVRGQGASVSRAAAQMAPVSTQNRPLALPATTPQAPVAETPVVTTASVSAGNIDTTVGTPATAEQNLVTSTQVPSVSTTKPKKTPTPKVLSDKDAMTQATVELQSKALSDPTYQAFVQKNPAAFGKQIRERANQLKAESEAKATQAPTTTTPEVTTNGLQRQEEGIVEWQQRQEPEVTQLDAPATPGAVNISDKAEQARDNLLRQATTAKEALETVASDAFAASPAMRTIANKLLGSGDLSDVKAEVADTPEQVAKLARKDGTTAGGRFTTVDNTMRVLPNEGGRVTQAAEVVIHEASHAATAAVVAGVRAGRIKDPEFVGDVEDAELARQAVAKAIADGTLVDDTGRADNAARNVDELLATVFSSPTLRTKLDTVRVTIPRRGPRRGRIATALQVIKDLVFMALKPLGITRQEVDQILVTEAVDKIVTRFAKEKSARDVLTGRRRGKSVDIFPTTISRVIFRGTNDSGERIRGGIAEGALFATADEKTASSYAGTGGKIERIGVTADANILVEGTAEFARVTGRKRGKLLDTMRQGENLKTAADDAAEKAKAAGYDALEFTSFKDLGIAIFDDSRFIRNLPDAHDLPVETLDMPDIKQDFGVEMPKYDKATSAVMRVADTAAGLLTPRGIATKDAQRMGERAVGVSNALRLEGEVLTVNLNKALDDVTEGMNIRQKAVYRYNVGAYLAGDPTVTDLPKSVKDAADAMREMLDNNTLRLIAVGAVAPKDIPKMLNNLGRWVHRDYEVFHYTPGTIGDPGGYFRKVQEMASQGYDVVAEVLPDVMDTIRLPTSDVIHKLGDMAGMKVTKGAKEKKQEYGKLLRQVQGKQEPKKPKNEKVKALREGAEQYLRDMAAKWGIGRTLPLDGDNGIVARLAALSDGGVEDLRAAAKRYANSLLDPDAAPFDDAPFKRNTGNNLSIDDSALDEARKDLPAWQRKLWGQFKDPATMFLVSLENQANIIAKFTALAEYKQRGLKSGNVKQNVAGMNAANMHPKGYYLLENKEDPLYYGPMQGMWVKQRDYAYLQLAATQSLQEKAIRESMGKWGLQVLTVPGQVAKMTIIGLDHTSQIMQYLSSVFMMSGSLTSPGTIKAASKGAAYTAFAGTKFGKAIADDTLSDDVKAWISQGVLINNALAGDARRKLRELAAQPGEIFLPPIVRVGKKVARGYRGTLDAASRILSFGDETSKIMMLYARMEHLSKIHPEMSREELRELAGEQTLATTPSYNREAPLAKIMGNSGYFNAFATFWAAQIRNTANHLAIAAKYSTMPGMAAKRYATMELGHLALKMAGVQVLLSGMGFLGGALAHALSDDEEEKKAIEAAAEMEDKYYAALRTLLPEFQLGDVRFLRESGEDKYTYVSAQRYDPMPFNSIMSASGREDYEELGHLLHSYLFEDAPLMRPMVTLFMNAPGAASNAVRKTFSSLSAEDLKATQEASKAIKDIGAALTPGLFKRPFKEMMDDKDITPMEAMFATAGFTVGELDLRKTAGQAAADYLAVSNLRTGDMSKEAVATDVTGTDIDWQDDILNRARSWAVARNKIKALQTIGKSDAWIREAIKSNPYASSMSKKDVDSLLNGQFSVPDYYKWLENKRTMELNKAGRNLTKRTEVNDKYDKLREELKLSEAGFAAALTKEGVLD